MTAVLVGCGKAKAHEPRPIADLYTGTYIKAAVAWARSLPDIDLYVLSAAHGLVPGDQVVAPYHGPTWSHPGPFNQGPQHGEPLPLITRAALRAQVEASPVRGRVVLLAGVSYIKALDDAAGDLVRPHNPFAAEAKRRWNDARTGYQTHLLIEHQGRMP